jgi:hypothetical protein
LPELGSSRSEAVDHLVTGVNRSVITDKARVRYLVEPGTSSSSDFW